MYPFQILINGGVVTAFKAQKFSIGVTIWKEYCKEFGATKEVGKGSNKEPYTRRNPKTGVVVQLKAVLRKHYL